jgi:hypothetical protein
MEALQTDEKQYTLVQAGDPRMMARAPLAMVA